MAHPLSKPLFFFETPSRGVDRRIARSGVVKWMIAGRQIVRDRRIRQIVRDRRRRQAVKRNLGL
jgi:hypothetical protein